MSRPFKPCSVCGIRCYDDDDYFVLARGGGCCNRCADEGGYDWLLARLAARGHEVGRDGFTLCPAHDDHRPSLHVSRARRDPRDAVIFCHAGCDGDDVLGVLSLARWHLYHPLEPLVDRSRGQGVEGSRTTAGREVERRRW